MTIRMFMPVMAAGSPGTGTRWLAAGNDVENFIDSKEETS
jgi:hypothetical protein